MPTIPLTICSNNVAFTNVIPQKCANQGMEDFVNYLSSCPLRFALTEVADPFLAKPVCEFYYSAIVSDDSQSIIGTTGDGRFHVSITANVVRHVLKLPTLDSYKPFPSEGECKEIIPSLGYDLSLQGNRDAKKHTLRQCLPTGWKYLTGVIGKCLGHKTGSLDQLNIYEQRLLYAIVRNRMLDFAQLIFDEFVDIIKSKKRPAYVPFPRWFALILRHIDQGYVGTADDQIPPPLLASKIINAVPVDGDPHITRKMRRWITNPYVLEGHEAESSASVSSSADEESEDEDSQSSPDNMDEDQSTEEAADTEVLSSSSHQDSGPSSSSPLITHQVSSPPRPPAPVSKHIYFHSSSSSTQGTTHSSPVAPFTEDVVISPVASVEGERVIPPEQIIISQAHVEGEPRASGPTSFETQVLSTLERLTNLVTSLDQRLGKVESDVAYIKSLMPRPVDQPIPTPPNNPPPLHQLTLHPLLLQFPNLPHQIILQHPHQRILHPLLHMCLHHTNPIHTLPLFCH